MSTSQTNATSRAKEAQAEAKRLSDAAREKVDQGVTAMHERAHAAADEVTRAVRSGTEETSRFVRENPGLALAAAAGFGLLVGLSMRNRF